MTIPTNQRLMHALQGNDRLAHSLGVRFMENAPILLTLLEQAWNRGDESSVHSIKFRLSSHLRVMGHQDLLECLDSLPSSSCSADLEEVEAWKALKSKLNQLLFE